MCGIAGVVSPDPSARSPLAVRRMLDAIRHRGPDDEGLVEARGATLGVRRLAIIDLSGGHQPMANERGTVHASQNGEIYNFPELRAELVAHGHALHTRSDTEILPHAYEEWGDAFVTRLRGMFALSIWHEERARLILARDRFGKKPLFYAHLGDTLVYGSEIQALLAHPMVGREVDDEAIDDYLTLGYVAAPRSAFKAIRKVPPAHLLVFEQGAVRLERYWRLSFTPKSKISFDDASAELRERIDEAVRIRLMSDVPLGAFLSGGLDSSAVVAFMARHSERPVKTFSIGFADERFDERRYARIVALAYGTDHQEFVVDAGDAAVLPMLVRHVGEPFADSSLVPTYHVARITRTEVTVALNGDGGDEMFAGYDRYKAAAIARLTADRVPAGVLRTTARVAGAMRLPAAAPRLAHRLRRFAVALGLSPEARHLQWTGYFTGDLKALVAGERIRALPAGRTLSMLEHASTLTGATDPAERFMASDIVSYLPDDLLVKVDIAAMATSLEGRSPFLDHPLAEFVASLPASYKLSPFTSKRLLRHALKDVLPREILERGKMGFSAPVGAWLRGPLKERFTDTVLASDGRGYVEPAAVRKLFIEHQEGRVDRTMQLWNLLVLELWFREVVESVPREAG